MDDYRRNDEIVQDVAQETSQDRPDGDRDERTRRMIREEMENRLMPKPSRVRGFLMAAGGSLFGFLLGAMVVGSGILPMGGMLKTASAPGDASSTQVSESMPISADQTATTVENAVAKKAVPSIVGITTTIGSDEQRVILDRSGSARTAVGSGVVVDANGYILTNAHVVNNGEFSKLEVQFSNRETAEAKLLWHDKTLDLAMIKVEKTGLAAIKIADSSRVQVGDKAIAIGNPLGLDLQSTLTSGYISGLERSITLSDGNVMDGLIQTDAAINSGNSGGALLNARGELIGINTAKRQMADGIGFAIPINTAKPIIDKITATGSYVPLVIGIRGYNVQTAKMIGVDHFGADKGVIIKEVFKGSPSEEAGLKPGDVLVAINGQGVDSMNSLKTVLTAYRIGDRVAVDYIRDGKKMQAQLVFKAFDTSAMSERETQQSSEMKEQNWLPYLEGYPQEDGR